jgi:hypothetical protein
LADVVDYSSDDDRWPNFVPVVTATDSSDMNDWLRKTPQDFGWAYVAIGGTDYNEAVAVVVADDGERLAIREIEWGRP